MLIVNEKNITEEPNKIDNPELVLENQVDTAYRVVLFNDDEHTFDEVINQLIKAIHCNFEKARSFAFEVHVKGKAMVYSGKMFECIKVSSILEEIALHTQIIG